MNAVTTAGSLVRPRTVRWRTVDIVVAAVIAAVFGAVYWAMGTFDYSPAFSFFPPAVALLNAVFIMAGPVVALIVRKPGAALFGEFVAAVFEALISTHWSATSVLLYGLVEGAAAELAFLLLFYRVWRLPVALLSGAFTGLSMGILDVSMYYGESWSAGYLTAYVVVAIVGGIVVGGFIGWYLVRALAGTGVLAPFAAGRSQRLV
jgi:energy-coupling factor transport system substrate-specific component